MICHPLNEVNMIYITIDPNDGKLKSFRSVKDMKKESKRPNETTYYHTPLNTITIDLSKLNGHRTIEDLFIDMGLSSKLVSEVVKD